MRFKRFLTEAVAKTLSNGTIISIGSPSDWVPDDTSMLEQKAKKLPPNTRIDGTLFMGYNRVDKWPHNLNVVGLNLTSFDNFPDEIIKNVNASYNRFGDLSGSPTTNSDFICDYAGLTSLKGAPQRVPGLFSCCSTLNPVRDDGAPTKLKSLVGAPRSVGNLRVNGVSTLTSLEGAPTHIGFWASFNRTGLTSLHNIHKQIKHAHSFSFNSTPIREAILGLLLIESFEEVTVNIEHGLEPDQLEAFKIINKYLPNTDGMEAVSRCQDELEEAGLDRFAEL